MDQGFMQHAAFPLQFEFLFDFPGPLGEEVRSKANPNPNPNPNPYPYPYPNPNP